MPCKMFCHPVSFHSKMFSLVLLKRLMQKLRWRWYLHQFSYLFLSKLFFGFYQSITILFSYLDMKKLLLYLNNLVFSGACLFKTLQNVFTKMFFSLVVLLLVLLSLYYTCYMGMIVREKPVSKLSDISNEIRLNLE